MDPKLTTIGEALGQPFEAVLQDEDADALRSQIKMHGNETTPISAWLETLGMRLQIRDLFMNQKIDLNTLKVAVTHGGEPVDNQVAAYLTNFDNEMHTLLGVNTANEATIDPASLRVNRVDRLLQEEPIALLGLVQKFSQERLDYTISKGMLTDRIIQERGGVVEELWSAAQTAREGNQSVAQAELIATTTMLNGRFDQLIETVMIAGAGQAA